MRTPLITRRATPTPVARTTSQKPQKAKGVVRSKGPWEAAWLCSGPEPAKNGSTNPRVVAGAVGGTAGTSTPACTVVEVASNAATAAPNTLTVSSGAGAAVVGGLVTGGAARAAVVVVVVVDDVEVVVAGVVVVVVVVDVVVVVEVVVVAVTGAGIDTRAAALARHELGASGSAWQAEIVQSPGPESAGRVTPKENDPSSAAVAEPNETQPVEGWPQQTPAGRLASKPAPDTVTVPPASATAGDTAREAAQAGAAVSPTNVADIANTTTAMALFLAKSSPNQVTRRLPGWSAAVPVLRLAGFSPEERLS